MGLRIAIAGIEHETSTYNPRATKLEDFEVLRGEEFDLAHRDVLSAPGGMLRAGRELGVHTVPILHAQAEPGGVIERSAYEVLRDELVDAIAAGGAVDAVGLLLHGAGLVEEIGELERDLAAAIRASVGPDIPIVATLDLHANNLSPEFFASTDIALGCRHYPHTDFHLRAEQAIRLVPSIASGQLRPLAHVETLPMVMAATPTTEGVAAEAVELCRQAEVAHGLLDCTLFHGFMHADWETVGTRVVSYADGDAARAKYAASEVAAWLWSQREDLYPRVPEAVEAVALAERAPPGLVILHEMADNPGGGAPGDGTHLLRAMLDANLERACFALIADPESVNRAHAAGVGTEVELEIGAKSGGLHDEPVAAKACVKSLTDGRFALDGPMWQGREMDFGLMARVRVRDVDVILASERTQVFDPAVLVLHGIRPEKLRYLGIKAEHHFRAGFEGLWAEAIAVDGPGLSSVRFDRFPREKTPRPLWPLDKDASYSGEAGVPPQIA